MKINVRIDKECLARAVDADKRTVRFLAQSTALASDRLVILADAGKRFNKEYMKNPITVPYHMRHTFEGTPIVVGSVIESEFAEEGMYQTVRFAETELGEQYWILYRDGHMRMVSIAWDRNDDRETDPKKMLNLLNKHSIGLKEHELPELRGVVKHYRQRDLSLVAIGADPKALAHAADEGNDAARGLMDYYHESADGLILPPSARESNPEPQTVVEAMEEFREEFNTFKETILEEIRKIFVVPEEYNMRTVVPFKSWPLAPVGASWDGPAQIAAADVDKLKVISTWYDSDNPDVKSSYKLPHHQANNNHTVWRGVAAAMAALLGARGGVQGLSARDRRGVYNHLAKHYEEFEKEPPEFREYTNEELFHVMGIKFAGDDVLFVEATKGTSGASGTVTEPEDVKPKKRSNFAGLYEEALSFNKEKANRKKPNFGSVIDAINNNEEE